MDRYKATKTASLFGICGNIFLLLIKVTIGIISQSQAMLADSVNSAGDILSSFMTFIGNKIASKPRDKDHNMGHGKAEYIFSMLISVTMIVVSFKVLYNSVHSLIFREYFEFSWWLVNVCISTIVIKICLYLYTSRLSKQMHNLLLEANAKDHRNDCIVTSFTLLSILLSLVGIYWFDGVTGIGISIWICYTGINIFKESYDVLMDKSISEDDKKKVLAIIKNHPEIKKVRHFNSTPVGYKYQISFTIYVDGNLSTFDSHEIADKLEDEIVKKIDEIYLCVIHVNPI